MAKPDELASQAATPTGSVAATSGAQPLLREIDAQQLFAHANAVQIRHGNERYTLRRTSKGKLILTK